MSVTAQAVKGDRFQAVAEDLDQSDAFGLAPAPASGWRAYIRGAVAELTAAGLAPSPARLLISGNLPHGAGLASSAALTVATVLALLELGGRGRPADLQLARLCAAVENRWAGAQTGLLDQLAGLGAQPGQALLIDFDQLESELIPAELPGCRYLLLDSGERHRHAGGSYNTRRQECARAAELLGVASLRQATPGSLGRLPAPLAGRARHVVTENERVSAAARALRAGDAPALGRLLNASHLSLRDDFEVSTPAVEEARRRLLDGGALGARLIGGGFGGSVLGLAPVDRRAPAGAVTVAPGPGARLTA